jgi:penicillin-binding protein 1C
MKTALPSLRKKRCLKFVVIAAVFVLALVMTPHWWLRVVPLPAALFQPLPPSVELIDRNGLLLRQIAQQDAKFSTAAPLSAFLRTLIDATRAAEDKRFFTHHGCDWRAVARAARDCLRSGRIVSGASTITQQLIKLAQPRPRTLRTKCIEALQAMRLEQVWTKDKILQEYLNRIDYGSFNRGAAAAGEFYFGKDPQSLSTAEAAFLAGLPQAPSRFNPVLHMDRARQRQQWVLGRMRENGALAQTDYERAVAEPVRLWKTHRPFQAPHFVDLILQTEPAAFEPITQPRLKTTLDLELNRILENSLRQNLARLRSQHVQNGAAVVIENATGNVLALVGSEDFFNPLDGQVNGAWAPRSSGSALKPFIYLLAFERESNPASIIADLPADFLTPTGIFRPVNYNHRCFGPMRARLALANSLNISAVKVLALIGGPSVLQQALQNLGLSTLTKPPEFYGLGLAIGNAEVRLLELANAYACLARLGTYKPFNLLPAGSPQLAACRQVFDPAASYLMADILSDPAARSLCFGMNSYLDFDFPVACKTGTSSDFRDNWAFGYTPEFTVGVWVGNFDGSAMRDVSGVSGAGPVLHDIFEHLHARFGTTWYSRPSNVVERTVHPLTGHLVSADHPQAVRELFISTKIPAAESSSDYDSSGRVLFGPEYAHWFSSGDNWLGNTVAIGGANSSDLRLVSPQPGTIFFIDPDLPSSGRHVRLEALGPATLIWQSDSLEVLVDAKGPYTLLKEGKHRLTVRHPSTGHRKETWIDVKTL